MKTSKYIRIILGIIIIVLLVAFGINASKKAPEHSYRIGVMVPLTGVSASFGERVKNGVSLAVRDIATAERTTITPLFEDDRGEAATAVTVANKLIHADGVKVIIGTVKSDAMLAVAPVTEKEEVILFSPTAGAAGITQAGDFVFRNIETPAVHGSAGTDFFASKGIQSTAVFIANASNAQGYGNAFISSFGTSGHITSTSTYNQADSDYRTLVAKALANKPQGIYLAVATAKDAGLLVRQIRDLGFTGTILASVAADAKEFFDSAGASAEGTYVSTSFFDPSTEPARSYDERFNTAYGVSSDAFAANAYDATMLLYQAMKSCGGDQQSACVRDYLYRVRDYQGVSGRTTFDRNGDVVKPVAIKIAHDSKFVAVK